MNSIMKIKKDKYLRKRGGTAKIITVACIKCKSILLTYQKDGPGWLKRCYLNRIIIPETYRKLLSKKKIDIEEKLGNLMCKCGNIIGSPIKYKDSRLAFHLRRGSFKRATYKKN